MSEEEFHEFSMKQRVYELVLSPYYPDVLSLLSIDNGLPAAVIEDRLKEKYADLPKVNSKTVYNFVQHVRRQEKIPVPEKIRQTEALEEFAYGSQAQVDFGTAQMRRLDGSRRRVYFFALSCHAVATNMCFSKQLPSPGKQPSRLTSRPSSI
jgi:hypothetical protein